MQASIIQTATSRDDSTTGGGMEFIAPLLWEGHEICPS